MLPYILSLFLFLSTFYDMSFFIHQLSFFMSLWPFLYSLHVPPFSTAPCPWGTLMRWGIGVGWWNNKTESHWLKRGLITAGTSLNSSHLPKHMWKHHKRPLCVCAQRETYHTDTLLVTPRPVGGLPLSSSNLHLRHKGVGAPDIEEPFSTLLYPPFPWVLFGEFLTILLTAHGFPRPTLLLYIFN